MAVTLSIARPRSFDFARTAYSHGWVVLAPNSWNAEQVVLERVERLRTGKVVLLAVRESTDGAIEIMVHGRRTLTRAEKVECLAAVSRMFRLDEDLSPFYRLCRRNGGHWRNVTRGLGRLLVSPTVWEDVVKVICTTNIQWGGTKKMVAGLVEAYGDPLPDDAGRRAFPTPDSIAAIPREEFVTRVRMGYRAPYIHELAERVGGGQLNLEAMRDPGVPGVELKKQLLSINGVGPYAAASLFMLLGRYGELAIDTVCRDFVSKKYFAGTRASDAQIRALYESWGEWKFLAYWFDLWQGVEGIEEKL